MRNKIDLYSRIAIALVFALLLSNFLNKNVFIASTPKIRPDLADTVVEKTLALVNIDTYLSLFRGRPTENIAKTKDTAKKELAKETLKSTLIPGVYAKETPDASLTEMHFEEVQWQSVPYIRANGEQIMINIPKGSTPPPPGMF